VGCTTSNDGCLNSQPSKVLSVGAAGPVTNFPVLRSHITIRSSGFNASPEPRCCKRNNNYYYHHHRHHHHNHVIFGGQELMKKHGAPQWRSKVRAGPCASIPKGPLFPTQGSSGPLQRWARVHCTPCTTYCNATGTPCLTVEPPYTQTP